MMSQNLALPFYEHFCQHPEDTALVIDSRKFSYAQLWAQASRFDLQLRPRVSQNPRVVILASRSLEAYAGILAACACGGTYIPLNPKWPSERILSVLGQVHPTAIIADEKALAAHEAALCGWKHLLIKPPHESQGANSAALSPAEVKPDHAAYIMFTSGTTGLPKGVVLPVQAINRFRRSIQDMYHVGRSDRLPQYSELSFDVSVFDLFITWGAGASLWVVPESKILGPGDFIESNQLTFWVSVPTAVKFMEKLKQARPGRFPSIRATVFIGEPLTEETTSVWRAACPNGIIDNHYGPTEAAVMCSTCRVTDPPPVTPGRGVISIGKPYPSSEFAIVDPKHRFLEDESEGELVIGGEQLATCYYGNAKLTHEKFIILDHPKLGRSRWYLTGDMAYRDTEGNYHHLGRNDRQVKILGYRVELDEVEAHLRKAYNTNAVAAVAWPMVAGSASGIVAFVEADAECATASRVPQSLPTYMRPKRVVKMQSLPTNLNRKIDRQALIKFLENEKNDLEPKA